MSAQRQDSVISADDSRMVGVVTEAAPAPVQHGAPRTLLYIEDNPANLQLIVQFIARRPDIRMLTAEDAIVGIQLARVNKPDVILMDINLPGISGIEALEILHADLATMHIPVIALSANVTPRDIEQGLQAGFFRYLTKPIKLDYFMETLGDALNLADKTPAPSK